MRLRAASTIERRVRRTLLGAILITFLVTVASVLTANDQLEQALLELDMQAEREFLLDNARTNQILVWDIATLTAYYVPTGMHEDERMPAIFRDLPFPFSGERNVGKQTYLITNNAVREGRLYLAKDITLFENREYELHRFLIFLGIGVIGLGILLARFTGKRLAAPIQHLAEQIRRTKPAPRIPRVDADYQDVELREIAQSFNLFLVELENYVKREQSLMGLASHELRTPIAVIAGALDVIEQRGRISDADRAPLLRMRRAVDEMAANIDVILRLTRQRSHVDRREVVALDVLLQEIRDDLNRQLSSAPARLSLALEAPTQVQGDPVLIKMLLRNLIQNALQHTQGNVVAVLTPTHADIMDQGKGLPSTYQNYLNNVHQADTSDVLALSGLGLFIVSLISERLGWRLQTLSAPTGGHRLRICFQTGEAGATSDPPAPSATR